MQVVRDAGTDRVDIIRKELGLGGIIGPAVAVEVMVRVAATNQPGCVREASDLVGVSHVLQHSADLKENARSLMRFLLESGFQQVGASMANLHKERLSIPRAGAEGGLKMQPQLLSPDGISLTGNTDRFSED